MWYLTGELRAVVTNRLMAISDISTKNRAAGNDGEALEFERTVRLDDDLVLGPNKYAQS